MLIVKGGGLMDVRWKDENGSILNVNSEKFKYLDARENSKTILKKEEIKKITIEDGLMNIFKDFENDLVLTIIIPKGSNRDAVKIFNEYDKTGIILKGKSGDFLLDLLLESSIATGNPFLGITAILFIFVILLSLFIRFATILFGNIGLNIVRVIFFGYPLYILLSYIFLRIKRKKLKEN